MNVFVHVYVFVYEYVCAYFNLYVNVHVHVTMKMKMVKLTAGDQAFLSTFVGNRCSTENLKKRKKKTYFSISRVLPRKKNQTTNFGVAAGFKGIQVCLQVCISDMFVSHVFTCIFLLPKLLHLKRGVVRWDHIKISG